MAVSIFDENTPHDGTIFTPFDESRSSAIKRAARATAITNSQSIDTRAIDEFRQGIEITTELHRLKGVGAKIWAGNIKGYTDVVTFGQALPFTEYEGSIAFEELPRFDPVAYINLGPSYPLPIVFNEGPQQNEETSIQPFTIPYRNGLSSDIDGQEKPRGLHVSLEDGNQNTGKINGNTSRIEQFKPYETTAVEEPFLEEGGEFYGESPLSGSIMVDGYVWEDERTINPFSDLGNQPLINQINTTDGEMIRVLTSASSSLNLDSDIRGIYGRASATAGSDVYGPGAASYGTDSIAYRHLLRGS